MSFTDFIKHSWSAFRNKNPVRDSVNLSSGMVSSIRPDRIRMSRGNERSIVTSVYNRFSLDVASMKICHVRLDKNDRYLETIDSGLNSCLTLDANRDQTGRAFIQDAVISMLDEGCVALVPTNTDVDPNDSTSVKIEEMRVGRITEWYPYHVRVRIYNEDTGLYEELVLAKRSICIIENPFYSVMNEHNSTFQRLKRKLVILDAIDEQCGSGKLDLIIQLPYLVKTEARKKQAEVRRKDIEDQLTGSKYGIAYIDGTEHITQLNRSVDNQLLSQIESLTNMFYSQLGITTAILDGTADEQTMLNYNNRIIEPILSAIVDEMKRKFLTKTARTQGQSIMFFREPFRLVPINNIADVADKFTRNAIISSNEMRQIIGMKPVEDPRADELRNKNLNSSTDETFPSTNQSAGVSVENSYNNFQEGGEIQNEEV